MFKQSKKLNKEKINFLRPIGLPHCFTCHKEHEMIHERFNYTPCTEKCGKWFNSGQSSNLDNEKWAIEFDKIFVDKVSLESGSSPLFRNRYLVTDVKQFIQKTLTSQREEVIDECIGEIDNYFGRCFASDGNYTDKELVKIMVEIIKQVPEKLKSKLTELKNK